MMFFPLSIQTIIIGFHLYILPELEITETTDTVSTASILELYLEFDRSRHLRPESMTNETVLILKLSISNSLVSIYQLHPHMGYTFPNSAVTQTL